MILVFNVGSSSIKFALFDSDKIIKSKNIPCIDVIKEARKIIADIDISKLTCIAHRVAHGGEHKKAELIDVEVEKNIMLQYSKAPLHNPYELSVIEYCKQFNLPQVAVYDTGFFSKIQSIASTYALPKKISQEYGIKKIGFHGISHEFITQELADILNKKTSQISLISCHLGSGSSIALIENGVAKDTSLGFSPVAGVMMSSRVGDLDPGIILYLLDQGLKQEKLHHILEHESGFLGLSGSKDISKLVRENHESVDIFCYQVSKYVASFFGLLKKCDGIVFTGGIGENSSEIRAKICANLIGLGIKINKELNQKQATIIAKDPSVFVIKTNEELMIAKKASHLISK